MHGAGKKKTAFIYVQIQWRENVVKRFRNQSMFNGKMYILNEHKNAYAHKQTHGHTITRKDGLGLTLIAVICKCSFF